MTKRNRLEKTGEETKQMLEEGWKQKWRKLTGATENNTTRTLECYNRLKFYYFFTHRKMETDEKHQ